MSNKNTLLEKISHDWPTKKPAEAASCMKCAKAAPVEKSSKAKASENTTLDIPVKKIVPCASCPTAAGDSPCKKAAKDAVVEKTVQAEKKPVK